MGRNHGSAALLSVDEAAEYLKKSPRTVWRLVRRNLLSVCKVKGRTLITLQSAQALKDSKKLSYDEMAKKVIELERKVEFLMDKVGEALGGPESIEEEYEEVMSILQKHHPDVVN